MMRLVLSLIASTSVALRLNTKLESQLAMPFTLDSAQGRKIPAVKNATSLYCEEDPSSTPRLPTTPSLMEYGAYEAESIPREHMLYGKCEDDSDCSSQGHGRPFCVDSICRECREGYEFEDCGPTGAFCNADNGFTCSTCASDNDCASMSYCRTVATTKSTLGSGKMPRKQCVKCEHVPEPGEVVDTTSCDWRCPIEQYFLAGASKGDPSSCFDCPSCAAGQFYAPRLAARTQFYSTCTNATDVICNDCSSIGIDDRTTCARILSPSTRHLDDDLVGDLGSQFPCRFFECKAGWFLAGTRNKCKKCHLTMCPVGDFLADCGQTNPGSCKPCKGRLPRNAFFMDPTDPQYKIEAPEDTCQFRCYGDSVLDEDSNACVPCDANASADEETACNAKRVYRLSSGE
jgi:hypothetical protein